MTLYIKSFTSAQRALRVLQRNRIRCVLARGQGDAGCGYHLKISDNTGKAEVCALLEQAGVRFGLL